MHRGPILSDTTYKAACMYQCVVHSVYSGVMSQGRTLFVCIENQSDEKQNGFSSDLKRHSTINKHNLCSRTEEYCTCKHTTTLTLPSWLTCALISNCTSTHLTCSSDDEHITGDHPSCKGRRTCIIENTTNVTYMYNNTPQCPIFPIDTRIDKPWRPRPQPYTIHSYGPLQDTFFCQLDRKHAHSRVLKLAL